MQAAVAVFASPQCIATREQAFGLLPPPLLVVRSAAILRFEWPSRSADDRIAITVFRAGFLRSQRRPFV